MQTSSLTTAACIVVARLNANIKEISRRHLLIGAGEDFKIYSTGYEPMLTKSEKLRYTSKKLCREARIERAEAERLRAAAKDVRALSQSQLVKIRASDVFPRK
jgi:hypothetical protein